MSDFILARGDTYAYFYPYWHARNAALVAGRLPLWSPDLFMGVPLLANSQTGALYPPNWLVAPLSPPEGVRLSILSHVAWALAGAYLLARRALALDKLPALLASALFALGGHVGAHIEQINQLQGLSWMPWLFLALHLALDQPLRYTPLLAMSLALQFFSGHTQTVFITGVGLCLYGLVWRRWRFVPVLLAAGIGALVLASPQFIPTLEMADVSNRRGGFSPNQATAFSFSPFALGRGLLPAYDSAIFGEYVAYPGVIGLGLALVGLALPHARRQPQPPTPQPPPPQGGRGLYTSLSQYPSTRRTPSPRVVWGAIALAGLLLALGVYNPVYWGLASLPGFNLFRVPARWLALFALGAAMLAGTGLQTLNDQPGRIRPRLLVAIAAVTGVLAALSPLAARMQEPVPTSAPAPVSFIGWGIALVVLLAALWVAGRSHRNARRLAVLGLAALLELVAASRIMPFNDLAPPEVYAAQRLTVSQMLAYNEGENPPGRILSISNLYFDPGDRATLEARYAALGISEQAVATAFTAVKMQETLAANLPLQWQIPAIDGYDGGLLPTTYYTAFTSLMLPDGAPRTLDGRLREFMAGEECRGACIPDARWLNLTGARYLITDKIYDLWHEDIAYDTQFAVPLAPGGSTVIRAVPDFETNGANVLYRCDADPCAPPIVTFTNANGAAEQLAELSAGAVDEFRLVRLGAADAYSPQRIEIASAGGLTLQAATLVDRRTDDFVQLALGAWRRALSSDIKLYENLDVMPRAFVVHEVRVVGDDEAGTEDALALMRDPAFDPARTAIIAGQRSLEMSALSASASPEESSAAITAYTPERIEVRVSAAAEGYLILADAYYPGWTAAVNDAPAPLLRADVMFRAVRIPAGESRVVFAYRPAWLPGALIFGAVAWLCALVCSLFITLRYRKSQ